ncbi:MAG: cache domain-containing protein [Deltaproteobacteria bacterium]|nr:cache domain-containing protein [Deltaproteobacteria bacterium]
MNKIYKSSIRFRLNLSFILIIVTANLFFTFLTIRYINRFFLNEVQTRVRSNINAARGVYYDKLNDIRDVLVGASWRRTIKGPLTHDLQEKLGEVLEKIRHEKDLDILLLTDTKGVVLFRSHRPDIFGDNLSGDPVIKRVLKDKKPVSGTVLYPTRRLQTEGEQLVTQSMIKVIDTPRAGHPDGDYEGMGMAMAAAVPFVFLSDPKGIGGVLYGAKLINRDTAIVDVIRDEVFQRDFFKGKPVGTATILLHDIRISTNVLDNQGQRALGTRLSAQVHDHVLRQGQIWADRAFVVNDWYITAYEPLFDPNGHIIGALYVGLLESPYRQPQFYITWVFVSVVVATSLISLVLLFYISQKIIKPVDSIVDMTRRVINGDLSARVGMEPKGEMGRLCRAIDNMADAVVDREKKLKEVTQQQITQSDKLASIGRLAAGVAHEINNPLTGILTFSCLVEEGENLTEQQKKDLSVVIRETTRVREIVSNLLNFARQSALNREFVDINNIIRKALKLLKSQKEFYRIQVNESLHPEELKLYGDQNQLQQVMLNILLNACESMPKGGALTILSGLEEGNIIVTIKDTGEGISKENLDKIFDPFYTTKPVGKGTGLGLSISYGIVKQHRGSIEVSSVLGEGTAFTILFPVDENRQYKKDEQEF